MSATGLSDTAKHHKKVFHRRNDSDELDVFEAARYFSGYNDALGGGYNGAANTQKAIRDDHHNKHAWRGGGGRMSIDVPMRNPLPHHHHHHHHHHNHHQQSHAVEKQMLMKEKKHKQPSSPGGRLASFLNALFHQTTSRKKKSKSATQSMKDEDESPNGRRRRRSSISHFRSSSTTDSKSWYSSSSSGFRTPPPYAHTPTKSYKDLKVNSDHDAERMMQSHHRQALPFLSKHNNNGNVKSTALQNEALDEKRNTKDLSWLDEKFRFIDGLSAEKSKTINRGNQYSDKDRSWVDQYPPEEKEYRKFEEVDDGGAESDSSSDLFELQNYDLGIYSSGLPVYETTHMDSIKRGALPISNGTL